MKPNNENEIDPIDVFVGERLRQRRELLQLPQGYLGDYVGVKFQQIQKYENATNRISASTLARFSRLLGVPVYYFFQGLSPELYGGGPPIAPANGFIFVVEGETQFYKIKNRLVYDAILKIMRGLEEGEALKSLKHLEE